MNDLITAQFNLTGRVALITGAARGLGTAIARALARAGATVILADIDETAVAERVAEFKAAGLSVVGTCFDVSKEAQVSRAVGDILSQHRHIDILVNNAGMMLRKAVSETTADEFRRILDVNLVSMLTLARAIAPSMIGHGYGRIINLSSIMGHIARAGQATYIASKHGIVGLTKALAAEFGPHGITCNAIAPGYFYTEMNRQILNDRPFHDSVSIRTPLRRWAEPEELGGTVIYLASPASAYLTGQTLVLDGGMTVTVSDPGQIAAIRNIPDNASSDTPQP